MKLSGKRRQRAHRGAATGAAGGPSLVVPGGQRATGPPTQGSPRPPNSLTCWPNINLQLQAGPVHHVWGGRGCGEAKGRGGGGFGGSVAQPPHGTGTPVWLHQPRCAQWVMGRGQRPPQCHQTAGSDTMGQGQSCPIAEPPQPQFIYIIWPSRVPPGPSAIWGRGERHRVKISKKGSNRNSGLGESPRSV